MSIAQFHALSQQLSRARSAAVAGDLVEGATRIRGALARGLIETGVLAFLTHSRDVTKGERTLIESDETPADQRSQILQAIGMRMTGQQITLDDPGRGSDDMPTWNPRRVPTGITSAPGIPERIVDAYADAINRGRRIMGQSPISTAELAKVLPYDGPDTPGTGGDDLPPPQPPQPFSGPGDAVPPVSAQEESGTRRGRGLRLWGGRGRASTGRDPGESATPPRSMGAETPPPLATPGHESETQGIPQGGRRSPSARRARPRLGVSTSGRPRRLRSAVGGTAEGGRKPQAGASSRSGLPTSSSHRDPISNASGRTQHGIGPALLPGPASLAGASARTSSSPSAGSLSRRTAGLVGQRQTGSARRAESTGRPDAAQRPTDATGEVGRRSPVCSCPTSARPSSTGPRSASAKRPKLWNIGPRRRQRRSRLRLATQLFQHQQPTPAVVSGALLEGGRIPAPPPTLAVVVGALFGVIRRLSRR